MASRKPSSPRFEALLDELENLVAAMENGDLPLDEAVQHFERGVELSRQCQTLLQQAGQKIEMLTRTSPDAGVAPFTDPRLGHHEPD